VKGEKTLAELPWRARRSPKPDHDLGARSFWCCAAGVFGIGRELRPVEPAIDVKTLHAKIGELTPGMILSGAPGKAGPLVERKTMIDCVHALAGLPGRRAGAGDQP
jgi:hypothetical protein